MTKEIIIHERENGNLCSIKSIENNYFDRSYLEFLITKLYNLSGALLVHLRRPNFDVSDLIEKLNSSSNNVIVISCTSNFFNISFSYCENKIANDLLVILSKLWFAFEHMAICIFLDGEIAHSQSWESWTEITSKKSSYVIFQGAEEDVVWIGKSDNLKFEIENYETS